MKAPANSPSPSVEKLSRQQAHWVEEQVQRTLLAQPGCRFSSLAVHRIENGVCVEGVLETDGNDVDICELLQSIDGIAEVRDRMLHRPRLPR